MLAPFSVPVRPDAAALLEVLAGRRRPERVHFLESHLSVPVKEALVARFGLEAGLSRDDPWFLQRREIVVHRFLGYDAVKVLLGGLDFPVPDAPKAPTESGDLREWVNERRGPVATWEEFERYPWPDPAQFDTSVIEWYERNLPEDMGLFGRSAGSVFAQTAALMGMETLCFALYEQPGLVRAVADRLGRIYVAAARAYAQFRRIGFILAGDDMGFRSGTLISPETLREVFLPWHKRAAQAAHDAGKPYFLHSCGKVDELMPDLVNDVRIDGKHSFEDAITPVEEFFRAWGARIAVLGGFDVDCLCRSDEPAIRRRVREILAVCQGGRYALGMGNSVADYVPPENYLIMLDEGRRWGR